MKKQRSTATLIIYIFIAAQFLPIPLLYAFPVEQRIEMSLTLSLVASLLATVAMIFINLRRKWTPEDSLSKKPSSSLGKVILWGVVGFIGAILIQYLTSIIEIIIFGITPESANTDLLLNLTTEYPLLVFSIVIFAPVTEEFVFRKAIFSQLNVTAIGTVGSAVISALLFAIIHFDGHMLVYASLGLWFSYLYYKTNNIFTSMLAHGLMNSFVALPLFFPQLLG